MAGLLIAELFVLFPTAWFSEVPSEGAQRGGRCLCFLTVLAISFSDDFRPAFCVAIFLELIATLPRLSLRFRAFVDLFCLVKVDFIFCAREETY